MQAVIEAIPLYVAPIPERPVLVSFDSGFECSLEHWMEVYRLVVDEDLPAGELDGEATDWN